MTATAIQPEVAAPPERLVRKEVRGLRLHARSWVTGARSPVVLVHGLVVSSRYLVPIAERLGRRLDVWAPDQPGYGQSDGTDVDPRPSSLARWLVDWLDAVGLGRVSLLANSYGCQVATELSMRWPERIDRLVLASPTMDPGARTTFRLMVRFQREASTHSATLRRTMRRDYRDAGVRRALATVQAARRDRVEDRLPFVESPTLVVRGTDDPMVSPAWAEEVDRRLPRSRLRVLDGVPHAMVHDGADALASVALPFLLEEG